MTAQRREIDPFVIVREGALILEIPIDDEAVAKTVRHLEILNQWRDRVNLTSLKDMAEMAVLHVLDSLTVFKVVPRGAGLRVLDVGSGAGFPGVVMAVADNSMKVTLMDGDPAKIVFLKHLSQHLELKQVAFLNKRLEKLLALDEPSTFDLVVTRAFSSKPSVIQSLSAFVSRGGSLVRMIGPSSVEDGLIFNDLQQCADWEGTLPFSSHFRRVVRYRRA
jgi:16S rRNA (guanine527-N7)-methyltransferase